MNQTPPQQDRRHKILLIVTSRKPSFDGDFLRFQNIFPLLNETCDISLLYLDRHQREDWFNAFAKHFDIVDRCEYQPLNPISQRLADYLTLRPEYDIRRRDPALFSTIRERISAIVERDRIDLIFSWVREAEQFLSNLKIPVLFDLCDALSLQLKQAMKANRSPRALVYYFRVYRAEAKIVARYPVTFVSHKDANWFRKQFNAAVIPNGVDLHHPSLSADHREPNSIVFSGSMGFHPNVQAALYFAQDILPILVARVPDLTWYIVGANPAPEIIALASHPNIVVTGMVESVFDYIGRGQIVITPMISGSGIKNKVLEAMAFRTAVVSTSLGIEGIACTAGTDALVADDPQEFAAAVLDLLADPARCQAIGEAGRRLVETHYSWEHTIRQYNQLFDELILTDPEQERSGALATRGSQGPPLARAVNAENTKQTGSSLDRA